MRGRREEGRERGRRRSGVNHNVGVSLPSGENNEEKWPTRTGREERGEGREREREREFTLGLATNVRVRGDRVNAANK